MSPPSDHLNLPGGVQRSLTPIMSRKESLGNGRGDGSPLPVPRSTSSVPAEEPLGGHINHDYVVTEQENEMELSVTYPKVPQICIDFDEFEDETIKDSEASSPKDPNFLNADSNQDTLSIPSRTGSRMSRASSAFSFVSVASSFRSPRLNDFKMPENEMFTRSLGLLLAFISGVLMTAYSSMIKLLRDMDSMQVVVIRGVMQLVIMGAIAKYKKLSFRGTTETKIAICLFFVAFTGGLRLLFIFTSFSRLPLGDSTTILFSSPVIVMVLSIFILKENCGIFRMVAATTLISGVVLIAKPPIVFGSDQETYDALGYSLVLSACVMSALGIVLTKFISKKVEKLIILFYLGVASSMCGAIGLFTFGHPSVPELDEWILAVTIGFLGLVQQYVLVWAVQLESPARVTIVRQMQIVLAYAVQIVLFGVMPTWTDLLGAGLVLATVASITFEKTIVEKCDIKKLCGASEEVANKDTKEKESQ